MLQGQGSFPGTDAISSDIVMYWGSVSHGPECSLLSGVHTRVSPYVCAFAGLHSADVAF